MRTRQVWRIGLCCVLAQGVVGCSFVVNGVRNVTQAPFDVVDKLATLNRDCRMANQAWRKVSHEAPPHTYSRDYACGFKEGFRDYLYAGGNCAPPPVAPWRYRCWFNQTMEGYRAMEDWFAGFSHGAGEARASGLRRFMVLPSSRAGLNDPVPLVAPVGPQPTSGPALEEPIFPPPEVLPAPAPRPLPAENQGNAPWLPRLHKARHVQQEPVRLVPVPVTGN